MTWEDWIKRQMTVCAMRDEADAAMLAEWARMFASELKATPGELDRATTALAMGSPPRFRADWLAALVAAVRAARAQAAPEAPPAADCRLCNGHGWVDAELPHPDRWRRGQYTVGVACRCAAGRWLLRTQGDRPSIGIDEYERLLPRWREIAQGWRAERLAYCHARGRAGHLDRLLGKILARVRKGVSP